MHEEDVEQKETAELGDYIRVVRERAWVIGVALVIVVAATLLVSLSATPQYRASARLVYQKNNLDQALFGAQVFSNVNEDREVLTGAALVKLDPVARSVAAQLGSDVSIQGLLDMVSVKPETNTNVVDIQAVSIDPTEAADVGNAFAEQFVLFRQSTDRATVASARELLKEQLDSLSSADAASEYGLLLKEKYENLRILESMQNGGFTIVQRALAPVGPFAPQPLRNAILAVIVGLVLGVGLAFLLDYLDKRIKDEKALEKELGVPVLASVPSVGGRWRTGKNGRRSVRPIGFSTHPSLLEPFRTLRSSLQYFSVEKQHPIWLITSGLPQEGKTVTTINLGLSLALSGKRVIILEADLRRPMVHEYLEVDQNQGLSNVLAGTRQLAQVLQVVKADHFVPPEGRRRQGEEDAGLLQRNLYAMTSGPLPPNPAELLASDRMAKIIQELAGMVDCLLIDTPPVLMVSDALVLARHADGVILAARLDSTTRDEARETRSILGRAGIRVIGVVAGGMKRSPAYYGKRGYGYKYGYGYEPSREARDTSEAGPQSLGLKASPEPE